MGEPQRTREHITLTYDPREGTPSMLRFVHNLESLLQRLELRIEALQDRLDALEQYNVEHP